MAAVVLLLFAASAAAADEDTTAPVGTLVIGDGSGYSTSLTVTLHLDATDDVAVTSVAIGQNMVPQDPQPYANTLQWTFPYGGRWTINVEWRDAAGNYAQASATVIADETAPVIGDIRFPFDPEPNNSTITVQIGNTVEDATDLASVRFRTNSGPWGAPIPAQLGANPMSFEWPMLDPAAGGSPMLGPRTVSVQVSNAVGLWSEPVSGTTSIVLPSSLLVTGDRQTGHDVTFTPDLPAGVTFPPNTTCWWEMAWGNDRSLYYGFPDETKASVLTSGPPGQGYCGPWTVTIPWVPYRQFLVNFRADIDGDPLVDTGIGTEPGDPNALRPDLDSTSRHIAYSSLPLVYVLPDKYELTVGVPATYRAYPVGGAQLRSDDQWSAGITDHAVFKTGGSSFTFTPWTTEHYIVCWSVRTTRQYQRSACYDPPARRRDTTRPNTTTPGVRIAGDSALVGTPTVISWTGSDVGWGIDRYALQRSVDGLAWTNVALPSGKSTSVAQSLAPGHSYRYRVRAVDKAGNVGYWDYGATFRTAAYQETSTSIHYSGTWVADAEPGSLGGSVRHTSTTGASATLTFTGRDVAWVATKGRGHGKATVYVDGVLVATVDLYAASASDRRLIFARHWSTVGTHTIRIVGLATPARPMIDVDAFLTLR
jgi:hypothetical protein